MIRFLQFFSGDMITIFMKPLNETCIRVNKYNNVFDVQKKSSLKKKPGPN